MRRSFVGAGMLALVLAVGFGMNRKAVAQDHSDSVPRPFWMASVVRQAMHEPLFVASLADKTPAVIPQVLNTPNSSGVLTSYQPDGATVTAKNAFFKSMGTNGRTCLTCHQPQAGWSMTPQLAAARFLETQGRDPLFSPVDGANCPNLAISAHTFLQKALASSQLITKGNIRVFL